MSVEDQQREDAQVTRLSRSPSNGGVVAQGSNGSVRNRLEALRDAVPEKIVKLGTPQSRLKEFQNSESAAPTVTSTIADYWLNLHRQREKEAAEQEARDIASGRLKIL